MARPCKLLREWNKDSGITNLGTGQHKVSTVQDTLRFCQEFSASSTKKPKAQYRVFRLVCKSLMHIQ
jgi:hypothetical protein